MKLISSTRLYMQRDGSWQTNHEWGKYELLAWQFYHNWFENEHIERIKMRHDNIITNIRHYHAPEEIVIESWDINIKSKNTCW